MISSSCVCKYGRDFSMLWIVIAVGLLTGCADSEEGPSLYDVSGTVSFDGAPLETGRILFKPKDGSGSFSAEIAAGEYSLETAPGQMTVEITASRIIPGKFESASPDEEAQPVGEMYVPEAYNAKTTLRADVTTAGENTFPFELTSS